MREPILGSAIFSGGVGVGGRGAGVLQHPGLPRDTGHPLSSSALRDRLHAFSGYVSEDVSRSSVTAGQPSLQN